MEALILSHTTALEAWDAGLCDFAEPARGMLSGIAPDVGTEWFVEGAGSLLHEPRHYLASETTARLRSQAWWAHMAKHPLASKSAVCLGAGIYAVTVGTCYLQLVRGLSVVGRARLAMELCGSYSTLTFGQGGFLKRNPLATVSGLRQAVQKDIEKQSRSDTARALDWAIGNSASPMETRLYLALCLPYRMGGFGLPKPVLNEKVPLPALARQMGGKSYYRCDCYWPDVKVALEYDSDQEHTGSDRISADAVRANVLKYLGITVLVVTRQQLKSPSGTLALATQLSRLLGKQLRMPEGFWDRHMDLRSQLFNWEHGLYDQWMQGKGM